MKKIQLLLISLLLSSCSTYVKKIPTSNSPSLKQRIIISDAHRKARKEESETFSFSEKELYFLQRFQKKFLIKPEFLVKRYHFKDGSNISAYIDESSLYLSYLALKTKKLEFNKGFKKAAQKIIKGIYYLDSLNKLDGYLPRFVTLTNNEFIISEEPIRTNSYSLLLFSYFLAYNYFDDKEIKQMITHHTELIIKYFLKNNLVLKDPEGNKIKYSNLKSNLILSRKLDALVLFEIANIIVQDKALKKAINSKLEYFKHKKYDHPKQIMRPSLGAWHLVSPSSHWLNIMKLYILVKATDNENYKKMFKKLYKKLKNSQNALFTLLYGDVFSLSSDELKDAFISLYNFPLALNNQEIINSSRTDISLKRFPRIIKNKRYTENKTPLPIFDRPLVYFEWKRNQYRVDGNFLSEGNIEFSGLDFLLPYALFPMHKIIFVPPKDPSTSFSPERKNGD